SPPNLTSADGRFHIAVRPPACRRLAYTHIEHNLDLELPRPGFFWQDRWMSAFGPVGLLLVSVMLVLNSGPLRAQDLDAGKSGEKLFASNCTMCHRTSRGLAKQSNRLSLFLFLRQHYTTSQATAGELAAYLVATDGGPSRAKQKPTAADSGPSRTKQKAAATDSGASRTKQKPAAAGQRQSSGSWWSTFIGGQKEPASKPRKKKPNPSAAPRPSADVTNR